MSHIKLLELFCAPPDPKLTRKARSIRKQLLKQDGLQSKKIAVLGGSTTSEIIKILDLYLLNCGIKPIFFEAEYGQYYEDIMFGNQRLDSFEPDVVFLHTGIRDLKVKPAISAHPEEVERLILQTTQQYINLWDKIESNYGCTIIQNNFDPPPFRTLGNLDGTDHRGLTRFAKEMNRAFAIEAGKRNDLIIHDIDWLAAESGLDKWHDQNSWLAYKCSPGLEVVPRFAQSLAGIIRAIFGKASKCLALDLDNTLWGGVIGDDGADNIRLGTETAESSAYLDFQRYIKTLKERGVILSICSKNEETNALEGLNHPDSVFNPDDFAIIMANWSPKPDNIVAIASSINISEDSVVFFDDNPAEREIIRQQLPGVAVIEPGGLKGDDVTTFITALDRSGLFETINLSSEDLDRTRYYTENVHRNQVQLAFEDYGEYLASLEMQAEIASFEPQYLDRIAQLTNKTNQFNLTTRRYTLPEIQQVASTENALTLYGRLSDKFGDNGLVSVILAESKNNTAHIDLWLMSCRVFKREMELAMFDALIATATRLGINKIVGKYFPTSKNSIVAEFYRELGFEHVETDFNNGTTWEYNIPSSYINKNKHIKITNG